MKNQNQAQILGVPARFGADKTPKMLLCKHVGQYHSSPSSGSLTLRPGRLDKVNKLNGKVANSIHEKVKRKLRLGAKILQAGGVEKIFKQHFSLRENEKMLKASQCYLSTTAGPIAGILFITTEKLAFSSENSLKFSSPDGKLITIRYKVSIPVGKIFQVKESHNITRPAQKYIQIVTIDNFDFWLMGFLSYQKTFQYLQQIIFTSR